MAQPQHDQLRNEIKFQHIELLKEQTLGVGSYGSVCKAKCDDLVCAAKIIHPTLVAPNERQQISPQRIHRLPSARFELECDFLRDIRHPNIIQFIGMYQDPGTGLPVLLMELMDESLTHFLESSEEPVPYHIQVVISQDISTALSFLHLNGIIHRDLSSNNILLIGKGIRAKLSDFGMAKLVSVHMTRVSNTVCPGTDAYMPPEAMDNQAVYSEKGDVFSFGVNIIQIVTKKFPKPGDRHKTVISTDPQFRSDRIRVCVSEVERRNNHISEIAPDHPLLPFALDCLKDEEGERPSVGDLCQRLAALKDTSAYSESVRIVNDRVQRIEELESTLAERDQLIKAKDIQLSSKENVLERLQDEIRQSKQDIHVVDDSKASKEEANAIDQQITELRKQVEIQNFQMQFSQRNLKRMEIENERLKRELIAKDQKQEGHEKLFLNEFTSSQHQSSSDRVIPSPQSPVSLQQSTSDNPVACPQSTKVLQPEGPWSTNRKLDDICIACVQGSKAPRKLHSYTDAVAIGGIAYCIPARTKEVLSYDSNFFVWSSLPDCPIEQATLAVVDGKLTTIGGYDDSLLKTLTGAGKYSSQLFSFDRRWSVKFPCMHTKRSYPIVVSDENNLVVAGGRNVQGKIATVEVMDIVNKQWFVATSLPQPMDSDSAALCRGCIYICTQQCLFTCSLSALLQSCRAIGSKAVTHLGCVWSKGANLPLLYSSLVSIDHHLFAISGCDDAGNQTRDVYVYDAESYSWQTVTQLNIARSKCFAVVLNNQRVLVIGGQLSYTDLDSTEFICI